MRTLGPTLVVGLVLGLMAGSTIGISAQEEGAAPQPPVGFTGVWCIGPEVADRDAAWRNAVSMSDPRLQGDAYQAYETHTYEEGLSVIASTLSIVNGDGAWVSEGYGGTPADGISLGNDDPIFVGHGTYEGLLAFMTNGPMVPRPDDISAEYSGCNEVQGVIIDGALAVAHLPE